MDGKKRILLVEDHTLLRQGLHAMLESEPDLEVVGEAEEGRKAIHLAATLSPHLILMDLSMPGTNGTEAIIEIKRRHPEIRILVLTVHKAEEYIRAALGAGAEGYVLKHATRDELMLAIRSILGGKTYLSPDVADQVVNGYLGGGGRGLHGGTAWESLTLREREVLKLI
ncbi:MAG TPA: response regulator transcription factor, partial [Chromatiales bacterium]|nr:response regulator transcription factor [Chromatiales bacterium]